MSILKLDVSSPAIMSGALFELRQRFSACGVGDPPVDTRADARRLEDRRDERIQAGDAGPGVDSGVCD